MTLAFARLRGWCARRTLDPGQLLYTFCFIVGVYMVGHEVGIVEGRVDRGMSYWDAFSTRLNPRHVLVNGVVAVLVTYGIWLLSIWAAQRLKPRT